MEKQKCKHEWVEQQNKLVCGKCNKFELKLKETNIDGLRIGIKDNGEQYSVRDSRNRYFYPDEWKDFISNVYDSSKIIFETLIMTGARIQEAMMIKKSHIIFERKKLILYTTKIKAMKQEKKSKPREISLSKSFIRKIKEYVSNMKDDDYIFLNQKNYKYEIEDPVTKKKIFTTNKPEKEIKIVAEKRGSNVYQLFKRALKKTKIKDTYNFSLHNIRKTHGMWLKCLNVKFEEICLRLGHDANTYLKHYGSADVFNDSHKREMINILGDIYGFQ